MVKQCSSCGHTLPDNANFCEICGHIQEHDSNDTTILTKGTYEPDIGLKENFFSYKKRLNRLRYIKRTVAIGIINVLLAVAISIIEVANNNNHNIDISTTVLILAVFIVTASIVVLTSSTMLQIRRFHDVDRSGWWVLTTFIPIVGIIPGIYLLFAKGTVGDNRFGPDPLQ